MTQRALDQLWQALPGAGSSPELHLDGQTGFASAFDVDAITLASSGAAALAGAELAHSRGATAARPVAIDAATLAATCATVVELDGEPIPKWASLSGYYRTSDDRLVQMHANFDHHASGIVARLGCAGDRASVEAAVATWTADELEAALIADDMICAKVRTIDEWNHHPHALATRRLPLVSVDQIGDADPRPLATVESAQGGLSGVRVLDCSRVLAGPVCGQTLAAQGADVLRVGAASLPSVPVCVLATGAGKRNTFIDLADAAGPDTFARLLRGAEVWVDAFRPGALSGHGFDADRAAALSPGIVVVEICAFDWTGPWAGRRGFDSIVQSTTGIVDAGSTAAGLDPIDAPTPLPIQALDYATGFAAAAAAARTLEQQSKVGGSWRVRVSLLRTRNWLVSLGGPQPFTPAPVIVDRSRLRTEATEFGQLTTTAPLLGEWPRPAAQLGSSPPVWLPR